MPMTRPLVDALKALSVVREGYVIRLRRGGDRLTDTAMVHAIARICRRAGLPERGWHVLRHTFATHAALLGANPWRLQGWLGHKSINTTMVYVHLAGEVGSHVVPKVLFEAAGDEVDPDRRVILALGARRSVPWRNTGDEPRAPPLRLVSPAISAT